MAVSETDKAYHRNFRLYFLVISYVIYIFYFRLFECNKWMLEGCLSEPRDY